MSSDAIMLASIVLRCVAIACIVALYYAAFAHIWFDIPLRKGRVAVCMALNSAATTAGTLLGGGAIQSVSTAVVCLLMCFILWFPSYSVRFIGYVFAALVSDIALEILLTQIYMKSVLDEILVYHFHQWDVLASKPATVPILIASGALVMGVALWVFALIRDARRGISLRRGKRYWLPRLAAVIALIAVIVVGRALTTNPGPRVAEAPAAAETVEPATTAITGSEVEATPALIASVVARCVVVASLIALYYALFANVWFQVPLCKKRVIACMALNAGVTIAGTLSGGILRSALNGAVCLAMFFILWHPRYGLRFVIYIITALLTDVVVEFGADMAYVHTVPNAIFTFKVFGTQVMASNPTTIPILVGYEVLVMGLVLLVSLWIQRRGSRAPGQGEWRYWLRMIAVIVALLVVMIVASALYTDGIIGDLLNDGLSRNTYSARLIYMMPIAFLAFAIWQVIQQYQLFVNNRALDARNKAYQDLLDGDREFHHNIVNLIYGFEGVLMGEDMGEIREYYADLARRCILTNNENYNALNQVKNAALAALIMRKMDRAAEMEIPFYLNIDASPAFRDVPPSRLVECAGNLLDNALEAAAKAASPRVDMTLRSADAFDEILIANTFAADADLSFLSGEARSSKPGHQATGIASTRRIVKRFPTVCFNQYARGRYIESSLCQYK